METILPTRRGAKAVIFVLGVLAAAAATNPAIAQKMETIIVTAPRALTTEVGHSYAGVPIEKISISYAVDVGDLDLTKPSGVNELDRRIAVAAKDACSALDEIKPLKPADSHCVANAVKSAEDQRNQAIAAVSH